MTKNISQLQQELDDIIAWFESEDIKIEDVSTKYEKALELVAAIEKQLAETENKIVKLNAKFK